MSVDVYCMTVFLFTEWTLMRNTDDIAAIQSIYFYFHGVHGQNVVKHKAFMTTVTCSQWKKECVMDRERDSVQ